MACSLTRTLTALLLVTACTSPREDPRGSNPAAQQNQSTNGGGGAGGGGASSSSSSGGANSSGGGPTVQVADCACGLATMFAQGECGICVEAAAASLTPQCQAQRDACDADFACQSVKNTVLNSCTAPDAACLGNLEGILTVDEFKLLSNLFACLCVANVCGTFCDSPAFSCEVTAKAERP